MQQKHFSSCDWKAFAFAWCVTVLPGNIEGLWIWNLSGTSAYQSRMKTLEQNGLVTNTSRANNDLYKTVLQSRINNRGWILSCSKPSCLGWRCLLRCWSSKIYRNVMQEQLPFCFVAVVTLFWAGLRAGLPAWLGHWYHPPLCLGTDEKHFLPALSRILVEQAKQVSSDTVQGMLCQWLFAITSNPGLLISFNSPLGPNIDQQAGSTHSSGAVGQ